MNLSIKTDEKKSPEHKLHFCVFCKREFVRIAEHFTRRHREEDAVKQVLNIKDKKEKLWMWKKLRQQGDYLFNISEQSEKRILVKNPLKSSSKKKYFNCPNCLARLRTSSKAQHKNLCKNILKLSNVPAIDIQEDFLNGLPEDIINKIRKSNYLNSFLKETFEVQHNRQILRTMARELVYFEQSIKKLTGHNKPLSRFFTPAHADDIIKAIKTISGCVRNKNVIMKYPHKAQSLCRLISNLCKFIIALYSKRNMDLDVIEMTKFINIFNSDSEKLIKKQALRTIKLRKLQNVKKLPKTSQIGVLVDRLKHETPDLMRTLEKNKCAANWRKLAENLLCRLTIFNRRRGGAVEKMKIKDYESTEIKLKTATEEATFNLNTEEREFLQDIKIVEITHKCDNLIPIYISKEIQEAMDFLLENRKFGDLNERNEYFFAASKKSLNPISGVRVLEKYREIFPDEIKKLFTATNLRKHGATVAQVLDLNEQDKEEWAAHMGHSVVVHNRYYRKSEHVSAVLKTGRLLNVIDKGLVKFYKGKKISEIPLKMTKVDEKSQENEKEVNDISLAVSEPVASDFPNSGNTTSKEEMITPAPSKNQVIPEISIENFFNAPVESEKRSFMSDKIPGKCKGGKQTRKRIQRKRIICRGKKFIFDAGTSSDEDEYYLKQNLCNINLESNNLVKPAFNKEIDFQVESGSDSTGSSILSFSWNKKKKKKA